ncbi:MAG: hypothetical protein K8S98_16395 [Planctomycetes bacterium]|nr:hypothetical protein [Planctomycetota bacterium]
MHFVHYAGLVACLALAGCSNLRHDNEDNDSLIAHLSDAQRKPIDAARTEQDHRSDELAVAHQDVVRAKAEHDLAKSDLDVADARVDKAKAVVAVAETGSTDDMTDAREGLRVAEAKLIPQRELIRLRECQVTRSEKAETLARREHELAVARVELEKSRAFAKIDRAQSRNVDVPQSEAVVREAEKQVALARVELDAASGDCDVVERSYDDKKSVSMKP